MTTQVLNLDLQVHNDHDHNQIEEDAPAINPSNVVATRRNQFIEQLGQNYSDQYVEWFNKQSIKKKTRIQSTATNLRHGLTRAAPIMCRGPRMCPFYTHCPIPDSPGQIVSESEYPLFHPCPMEQDYVINQLIEYIKSLDVDPANTAEMSLIQELALLDLLRNRAVLVMSNGDSRGQGRDMLSTDESVAGFDGEGQPLMSLSTKVHPAVEIMDKHEKRRGRILEQFAATRSQKFKLQGNLNQNSQMFQILNAIQPWMEEMSRKGVQLTNNGVELGRLPDHSKNRSVYEELETIK